jgi:hypothetical protein
MNFVSLAKDTRFIDYQNAQIILIGAREGRDVIKSEIGIELNESQESADNIDKMSISISAFNGKGKLSDDEFEKITRENNPDTITQTAGAMLVQDTECTKYVIDGQKTCTMIYTEPSADGQYTEKILYVTFDTEKQDFIVSFTGPTDKFDNSLPIFEAMLNSIKAP